MYKFCTHQTYTHKLSIKIYNLKLCVKVICTSYDILKTEVVEIFFKGKLRRKRNRSLAHLLATGRSLVRPGGKREGTTGNMVRDFLMCSEAHKYKAIASSGGIGGCPLYEGLGQQTSRDRP
jgi:hypothetical protein